MLRVHSHPEAEEELSEATFWYESRQPGLGAQFLDDFEATLKRIKVHPERWAIIATHHRKLNFKRFPFAVIYSLDEDILYVKAIMHLRRRPFYWKHRE